MRLHRRRFFAFVTSCIAVLSTSVRSWGQVTFGGPTGAMRVSPRQFRGSGRVASLQDQLNAGLRARRPVEFKFIADAVKLVEQRKLPVRLVVESYDYARKKRTRHPFQYFQRVLAIRAPRLGIVIKIV